MSTPSSEAKSGVWPIERPAPKSKPKSTLKRRKPLRRSVTVKAGKVRSRLVPDELPAIWHRGIEGTTCVGCQRRPAVEAHHIIRAQTLRKEAQARGFDFETVRWDARNRLGLCRSCHAEHHSGKQRLSHDLLWRYARWVYAFAEDLGLEFALEREYTAPVYARTEAAA